MYILFAIIFGKKLFFEAGYSYHHLTYHLLVVGFFYIGMRIHSKSTYFTRYVPIIIGIISYYGHTRFLTYFNHSGFASSECSVPISQQNCQEKVALSSQHVDLDDVFRHIIIFGAFFINHIYIDIFLTVTDRDSLLLNIITWGLLS